MAQRLSCFLATILIFLGFFCTPFLAVASSKSPPSFSEQLELGRPLISHFGPRAFQSHPQQWAVAQGSDGRIYSASSDNILEFDGHRWRKIVIDPGLTVRSLASAPDGRIYVGAQGEVGVLEPDSYGRMSYISLSDELPDLVRRSSDVWRTHVLSDGVYFSTFDELFRYSESGVDSWPHENGFHFSHSVGDRLFILVPGEGLKELVDDQLNTVSEGDVFADSRIYAMEAMPDEEGILIATGREGLFLWQDDQISSWTSEADPYLTEGFLYHATVLSDGRIVAGTVSDGVFLLDSEGRWLSHINRENGLPVNEVNFIFEDRNRGVWLAQDLGLSRLEWHHPVTVFDDDNGPSGTVLATSRHGGDFLAATTQGLFYLEPGPKPRWVSIEGIQSEVWAIESLGDRIFAASHQGVYEIRRDQAELIHELDNPATTLVGSQDYASRLYLATRSGEFLALDEADGRWVVKGVFEGLPASTRGSVFSEDGSIWLGSEQAGMVRLTLDESAFPHSVVMDQFGVDDGLSTEADAYPVDIDNEIYVAGIGALHRFEPDQNQFVVAEGFLDLFEQRPVLASNPIKDQKGRLWVQWEDIESGDVGFGYSVEAEKQSYQWHPSDAFHSLEGSYIHHIHLDDDGVFWFSGIDLFRYNSFLDSDNQAELNVLIRDVLDVEGHSWFDQKEPGSGWALPYSMNRIRFDLAVPRFDRGANPELQIMLSGLDQRWSSWSEEPLTEYANLREGDYRFKVRARDSYGNVSEVTQFEFSIMPPWYRSVWAYLFYLIAIVATIWLAARWRFQHLEAQKRQLEGEVQLRTQQLEEAMVTDPLTSLRNRRYLEKFLDKELSDVVRRYDDSRNNASSLEKPSPHVFFMIDIDHFKQVNDTHGHSAGDRVLEQFGEILHRTFRESDFLVRWGGEEFLVIARQLPEDKVEQLADRLRRAVEEHDFDIGHSEPLKLTCSIGFAEYPPLSHSPDALDWLKVVDLADHCLYAAKKTHRNAWVGIRLDYRLSVDALERLRDEPAVLAAQTGTTVLSSLDRQDLLEWG